MKKLESVLNILLRGILGTIGICCLNLGLSKLGIALDIGINAVTFLTTAILGFPGFVGLYVIELYGIL